MKKFLKWLIPCLVAFFMVVGLVQTASFTFATTEEVQTEETNDVSDIESVDEVPDDTTGDSGEGETEVSEESDVNSYTLPSTEDEEEFVDPEPAVISPLGSGEVATVVPDHTKYITKDKDKTDLYYINLNIKGFSETEVKKPKVDVILIIDKSGSMKDDKMHNLKQAVIGTYDEELETYADDGLINSILGNDQIDSKLSIISFSDDSSANGWFDNTKEGIESARESALNIGTGGGTNPTAALKQAKSLLQSSEIVNDGAEKYVIYLTDGEPTYYVGSNVKFDRAVNITGKNLVSSRISGSNLNADYKDYYYEVDSNGHYTGNVFVKKSGRIKDKYYQGQCGDSLNTRGGNGYSYDDVGIYYNRGAVILGIMYSTIYARQIIDSGVNFYTIGYGINPNSIKTSEKICNEYLRQINRDTSTYTLADTNNIKKVFDQMVKQITNFDVSGVTIKDVLSDYVELPVGTEKKDIALKVMNGDSEVNGLDIKVNVSIEGKTITAKIVKKDDSPYTLNAKYTYILTIPIKPSEAAYTYLQNHDAYPNKSVPDKIEGFYSNAENDDEDKTSLASIEYSYKGITNTVPYKQKPVIQISQENIGVKKVWQDVNGNTINKDYPQEKINAVLKVNDIELGSCSVESKDSWKNTIKIFTKDKASLSKNSITESTLVNDYYLHDVKYDSTKGFTLYNRKYSSLTIKKEVTGRYADKSDKTTTYKIYIKLNDGNKDITKDIIGQNTKVEKDKGGYYVELIDGESVKFDSIKSENYTYSITEVPVDGFTTEINVIDESEPDWKLKGDETVVVTNKKTDIAVTGITDNTPKGLGLIGTIIAEVAAIAFVLKKKRQLKM